MAVSGIVIVRPGSKIFPKESTSILHKSFIRASPLLLYRLSAAYELNCSSASQGSFPGWQQQRASTRPSRSCARTIALCRSGRPGEGPIKNFRQNRADATFIILSAETKAVKRKFRPRVSKSRFSFSTIPAVSPPQGSGGGKTRAMQKLPEKSLRRRSPSAAFWGFDPYIKGGGAPMGAPPFHLSCKIFNPARSTPPCRRSFCNYAHWRPLQCRSKPSDCGPNLKTAAGWRYVSLYSPHPRCAPASG